MASVEESKNQLDTVPSQLADQHCLSSCRSSAPPVRVTSISTESRLSREAALVLYPSSRESYCQPEFWQWQSLALQILAACHTQTHIWSPAPPCIATKHCTSTHCCNVLLLAPTCVG